MAKSDNGEQKATLEERKARLESELEDIRNELGGSWEEVKRQVKNRSKGSFWLHKFPITSVSLAFLLGMWLARDRSPRRDNSSVANPNSVRSLLTNEFKHIAVQRLTRSIMNQIDQAVDQIKKEKERDEDS